MISTTLGELADAQEGMSAVMKLPLPAVTAWKVTKLAQEVLTHATSYLEQRNKAVERLGVPDPKRPGYFDFEGENGAAFDAEMADLRAQPIEITATPISLKSLGGHGIAGAHLHALGPLLVDDLDAG